jgi:hypothetical protein
VSRPGMVHIPRASSTSILQQKYPHLTAFREVSSRRNTIFTLFDSTTELDYNDFEKALDDSSLDVPSFDDFEGGMSKKPTKQVSKPKASTTSEPDAHKKEEVRGKRIRANVRETGFDSMKYYMKTMGNHELLQKNEEIVLGREVQVLIKWEEIRENLESELLR